MPEATPNAYLRTKVQTANPSELRLMLLEGSVRFARQGREALEQADHEAAFTGITRCQSILMELINGLRPEHDPSLCEQLSSLYTYLYMQLVRGLRERDLGIMDEVIKLLEYERETWSMVLDKLAEENASAGQLTATPDAAPTIPSGEGTPTDSLVGGSVWKG
ncbi:MAG: flagellar export chaperone FliS [Planctomycetota bacterium]|jgi:flagellar protein FliS